MSFVHLHNHTEYSMLDGYAQHDELATEVARLGQPAVAMTDHGNMFGSYSFYHAMTKANVKPIIGVEGYVAPKHRRHKQPVFWGPGGKRAAKDANGESGDVSGGGAYTHLTLLARNATGLSQLYELTSRASMEGQYPKPKGRMDRELLAEVIAQRGRNIIASTGCPGGEVQTRLRLGQYAEAREAAAFYQDLFGPENYFLEVMDHGLAVERQTRAGLLQLGKDLDIPPLATNDSHYVHEHQAPDHDALLCIGTGRNIADTDRFKFDGAGYYIKTAAQMRKLFDREVPGACDNTLLVASMVEPYDSMFAFRNRMPRFPAPAGHTEESWLRHLVEEGLRERCSEAELPAARARAESELSLIVPQDFAGYFLAVHGICQFMRSRGIRFAPRGSAAGSIVVYALHIAAVDPIEHELMFERFINPERIEPPDIDIDIDESRRDEVIRYIVETYGEDRVSQIITFGRIKARAAVKDSARILGLSYSVGDRASKAVPPDVVGRSIPLSGCFDEKHPRYAEAQGLRDLRGNDPEVAAAIETALKVEGRVRAIGKHACGVIVSAEPLLGQVPLHLTAAAKAGEPDALVAGHEFPDLMAKGLQKMDLLGLRNWTVVDRTIAQISERHGVEIDLAAMRKFDDPAVYALLGRGETLGLFQVEGGPMQALLRLMKPTGFEDILAAIALYRPGPMGADAHNAYAHRKNGRAPIVPIHQELEEPLRDILSPTYGVIAFQEQVIKIAQRVAGYSLGRADLLRKAMGKKKPEVLAKEFEPFRAGMLANGYSEAAIKTLWDTLLPFADYAFGRCVIGSTQIVRLGRGSHEWSQTVRDVANRLHGREDYDGSGCQYCYNEKRRVVSPRSRECTACKAWRGKWRMQGGMNAAGRVGDRILPVKIVDAFRQGVKPVWKVTLANGMSITSTANHRHLTLQGWRRTDELSPGDDVATMAAGEWGVGTPRTNTGGASNWVGLHGFYVAERSHGKAGPFLHGRHAERTANVALLPMQCQDCGATEGRLDVAHLDSDPLNNSRGNLRRLCRTCHWKLDYKTGSRVKMWRKGRAIESSKVVSVEYAGEEMTYDVTVDSEDHSWVANGGIVTHNSHSACYASLVYYTAWLKAHYPTEYMSNLLGSVGDDKAKLGIYLAECRRMGITVQPPDINDSGATPTPIGERGIRFGLSSIKDVGAGVVEAILAARAEKPYASFLDYAGRVASAGCTDKAMLALIQAGTFDSFGVSRRALAQASEAVVDAAAGAKKKEEKEGAFTLFSTATDDGAEQLAMAGVVVDESVPEWGKTQKLAFERERLGLYLSGHPLDGTESLLAANRTSTLIELVATERSEGEVHVSGMITDVIRRATKAGDLMATFTLEDLTGTFRCVVFPRTYQLVSQLIANDTMVSVKGRLNRRDETEVNIVVDRVLRLDVRPGDAPVELRVPLRRVNETFLDRLRETLERHAGERPTRVTLERLDGTLEHYALPALPVEPSVAFQSEVKGLLGQGALQM